jgi:hypothetical protein
LHPPLRATFIGGGPAIAYTFDGAYWEVRYTYATTPYPEADDWISTQVDGGETSQSQGLGLCEINGTPRVAFEAGFGEGSTYLAASPVAFPGSSDWEQSLIAEDAGRPSLACVNDTLACSYFISAMTRAKYARALTEDPSGPASWYVVDAGYDSPMDYRACTNLIANPIYGGEAPAVLYRGHTATATHVACATVSEPTGASDWNNTAIVFPAIIGGYLMELKLIRGVPAVVYFLESEHVLQFAWANADPPASIDDWTFYTLASDVNVTAVTLDEFASMAAVAYFDSSTMEIRYAYFENE